MEEKTTDNRNTFAIKTFLKDYLICVKTRTMNWKL